MSDMRTRMEIKLFLITFEMKLADEENLVSGNERAKLFQVSRNSDAIRN